MFYAGYDLSVQLNTDYFLKFTGVLSRTLSTLYSFERNFLCWIQILKWKIFIAMFSFDSRLSPTPDWIGLIGSGEEYS